MQSRQLYGILRPRARAVLLTAIFFIFAPVSLVAVSNIGKGWNWVDLVGWMVGSALISVSWAYAAFKGKHWWLPISANVVIPMSQGILFSGAVHGGNFGVTAGSIITVASIALGYVMFVVFIRGEGARTVHLQTEIELAKEIHDHLVPDISHADDGWEILGSSKASTEVGGDLLDLVAHNGRLLVTVADVSGHGVRAGVMMAMIKSALRTKLLSTSGQDDLFSDLNNVVHALKRPDMYATGVHLALADGGCVEYVGAGHPSMLHVRAVDGTCLLHDSQNPPLGVLSGLPFSKTVLKLEPGDCLLVLTDGLIEAENKRGVQFGTDRIRQVFTEHAKQSLEEIRQSLVDAVRAHGAQDDDQTLVLIRAK